MSSYHHVKYTYNHVKSHEFTEFTYENIMPKCEVKISKSTPKIFLCGFFF